MRIFKFSALKRTLGKILPIPSGPKSELQFPLYISRNILTLSSPGGGGSETRMTKLAAADQKPLTL